MKKLIYTLMIVGLFAGTARAAAPDLIPIQGVLTDSTGAPIDTSVTAVFSLYTSETGGTALWTETQSVLVEDGLFVAYLGDVTTLDLTTFRDNGDLWLGIRIGSDAEMQRVYLGSTPFSGYAEYCGNIPTHTHAFGDLTGSISPSTLPSGVVIGALSCSGTDKVSGVDSSGALVCSSDVDTDTDTDTTYTAGTGLTLSGTVFSADTSVLQSRVSGTCPTGQSIRVINADGTVLCEVDTDTNTTYSAGNGLDLSVTTFIVDPTDFNGLNPAVDSYGGAGSTTGGTDITLRTNSIDVPGSGRIVAIGKANAQCTTCANNTEYAYGYMTVSTSSTGSASSGAYSGFASIGTGSTYSSYVTPMSIDVFSVTTSGTYTYYLRAGCNSTTETMYFYRASLTLFFIPN